MITVKAFIVVGAAAAVVAAVHHNDVREPRTMARSTIVSRRLAPAPDYGPLPDFAGGTGWLNGSSLGLSGAPQTLTASALRGKVVVVNVWTFECYNCLNALPHIKALEAKYRGKDVVVIGVHTPELARERVPHNVASALERLGVTYPNVLDPDYRIWRAFHNEYWPSVYIAGRDGRIRFQHFGEGAYGEEDEVVSGLLAEPATRSR
jgi:thiol-disulfide isomerase/thioredoxin